MAEEPHLTMETDLQVQGAPAAASETTAWKRRRPAAERPERASETEDDARSVASQWQPDAADVEMMHSLSLVEALPVGRLRLDPSVTSSVRRRVKRMRVDEPSADGSSSWPPPADALYSDGTAVPSEMRRTEATPFEGSMRPPAVLDEHTGSALLCFLSEENFVGFVEIHHEGQRHVLKLNGSESLTKCDRNQCAVPDCTGDRAYLVTAQSTQARRKRTYLARCTGVGEYVAFEGRGMRFTTDFVPASAQREEVLGRHFGILPRAVRRDSMLCLGRMTLQWRGLATMNAEAAGDVLEAAARGRASAEHEGYAGDQSCVEGSSEEEDDDDDQTPDGGSSARGNGGRLGGVAKMDGVTRSEHRRGASSDEWGWEDRRWEAQKGEGSVPLGPAFVGPPV